MFFFPFFKMYEDVRGISPALVSYMLLAKALASKNALAR
jgi:hypothetical protein